MSRNLHDMPVSQVEWEAMQADEITAGPQLVAYVVVVFIFTVAFVCGFLAAILVL